MNDVNHPVDGHNNLAEGLNTPDNCPEAACVDAHTSRSILDEASEAPPGDSEEEEPTALEASAGSEASGVDPTSRDRPASPGVVRQEQRQIKSIRYDMLNRGPGIPIALAVLFLVVYIVRRYYQHKRQQIEWRRSSTDQLEMIRKRIHGEEHVQKNVTGDTEEMRVDVGASGAKGKSSSQQGISSDKDAHARDDSDQQMDESNNHPNLDASNSHPESDHISEIRAKQQENLDTRIKSNHLHLLREKNEKKLMFYSSLDHLAADDAYQRRMNVIAEEQKLLRSHADIEQEQQPFNDLEEMERIALVQQQDAEYQESFQIDRDRSTQLALIGEIALRRENALGEAKERLAVAGVQSGVATQNKRVAGGNGDTSEVKLRLLLPSGEKIDGTFDAHHAVGLVYDLALLMLDRNNGLWSKESGRDNGIRDVDAADGDIYADSSDENIYYNIQREWKKLFYSFSIVSSFPQRTFDDLSLTLDDCGLSKGVTLMVLVDESS
ncbi:hypothetical protein ACHAW5_002819 [Stephanodiscus triporus]|uniref:UBX domain-containing protein n=1 Tax=Stephanodiscus triporus TaxID=2934178 RepID=A0ABD3Q5C2_9STRA